MLSRTHDTQFGDLYQWQLSGILTRRPTFRPGRSSNEAGPPPRGPGMMAAAAQKLQTGHHAIKRGPRTTCGPGSRPSFDGLPGMPTSWDAQGFHCDQYQSQFLATLDGRPTLHRSLIKRGPDRHPWPRNDGRSRAESRKPDTTPSNEGRGRPAAQVRGPVLMGFRACRRHGRAGFYLRPVPVAAPGQS